MRALIASAVLALLPVHPAQALETARELAASGALDGTYTYPGTERTFPSWQYDSHTIWGLTRRILDDLVAAAR